MDTANHGDNIFLSRRCEFLSSLHYSNDLKLEDVRISPTPAAWECAEISTEALHKHRSCGVPRPHRSRSSPVRSGLSASSSPERRARSPSVSATRLVLPDAVLPPPTVLSPHDTLYSHQGTPGVGPSAMSYFSPRPPPMPLYIVPLPPNPSASDAQIEKIICSQHQSKVKGREKTGRRTARHLLNSILKKLPINTETERVEAVKVAAAVKEPEVYPRSNRSVAIQALSNKILSDEDDDCSSSETSVEWEGTVRALRDSHVRLVLRQLRHLRDIERLNRALHREHAHE